MLQLPQSTEVKRPLPKTQLFKRFDWKQSQRDSFDADVSRLDFVNWISPRTLPAIAEGDDVKELFVIQVSLKRRNFDTKSITLLAKSIPQRVVYTLSFENDIMLALYHSKLYTSIWQPSDSTMLSLTGLNLDAVWRNIVSSIGQFSIEGHNSLSEQIKADDERAKLMRQIESLERQMNSTKQPHRKRYLFLELQKLKSIINA